MVKQEILRKREPVKPAKPETCGTVSNDVFIQLISEALFNQTNGWFDSIEHQNPFAPLFRIEDMQASTGVKIPSDVAYPWNKYSIGYGDITFTLDGGKTLFDGDTFYPFIFKVGIDGSQFGWYIHNLAISTFVGANVIAELAMNLYGYNPSDPFGSGCVFALVSNINPDGTIAYMYCNVEPAGGGKISITLRDETLKEMSRDGAGSIEESYLGYVE